MKISNKAKWILCAVLEVTTLFFFFRTYQQFYPDKNLFEILKLPGAMILFAGLQILVFLGILRLVTIPTLEKHRQDHGSSKWAEENEFLETVYSWDFEEKPPEGGVFVGAKIDDHDIPQKSYHVLGAVHNLIIAATRSGKTRRVILETIYQIIKGGESLVINDPKGEIYLMLADFLKSEGYEVVCIDFRAPLKSNFWNPLALIQAFFANQDRSAGIDAAWDLANILVPSTNAADDNVFERSAQSLLAGGIIYICMETKNQEEINMASLHNLLIDISDMRSTVSLDHIVENLSKKHPARKAWGAAYTTAGNLRASVFANALTALRLYTDPAIETMTSKQDHDMASVGQRRTAIFNIIPDEKSTRHSLAVTYHSQLYQVLIQTAINFGGRLPIPVHYIYDEFGNSPVNPDMGSKITAAASRGIKFYLVLQDLQQLQKYGEDTANTILANMINWIYISTNNPYTSKVITEKLGIATVETSDLSYQDPWDLIPTHRASLMNRELKKQEELLRWKNDHLILMPQGQNPSIQKIVDISKYPFYSKFGLDGNEEVDKSILHHRENMRQRKKEIDPPIFDIELHQEEFKKEIYRKYIEDDLSSKAIAASYQLPEKRIKKYLREMVPKKMDDEIELTLEAYQELQQEIKELLSEKEILEKTVGILSRKGKGRTS